MRTGLKGTNDTVYHYTNTLLWTRTTVVDKQKFSVLRCLSYKKLNFYYLPAFGSPTGGDSILISSRSLASENYIP